MFWRFWLKAECEGVNDNSFYVDFWLHTHTLLSRLSLRAQCHDDPIPVVSLVVRRSNVEWLIEVDHVFKKNQNQRFSNPMFINHTIFYWSGWLTEDLQITFDGIWKWPLVSWILALSLSSSVKRAYELRGLSRYLMMIFYVLLFYFSTFSLFCGFSRFYKWKLKDSKEKKVFCV